MFHRIIRSFHQRFFHQRLAASIPRLASSSIPRLASSSIPRLSDNLRNDTSSSSMGVVRTYCHSSVQDKVGGGGGGGGGGDYDEISLRPFEMMDADDVVSWGGDEEDELIRYLDWSHEIYKTKEQVIEDLSEYFIPHPWMRAICLNNVPIGRIVVDPFPPDEEGICIAAISYIVICKHRGKGVATKAVKMVLDTIFKEWPGLDRLEASVDVTNIGSLKVINKVGFKFERLIKKFCVHDNGRVADVMIFNFNRPGVKLSK